MKDDVHEKNLELAYKTVCEFEKASYEKIYTDEHNQIVLEIDKDHFLSLEGINEEEIDKSFFEPMRFPSYRRLFHDRYKNIFSRNIKAIKPELLKDEIGEENLMEVINQDKQLKERYLENIREHDLDTDGIFDRIDIDDTRNSVQTVADLSLVNNSTDKETERYNKRLQELER